VSEAFGYTSNGVGTGSYSWAVELNSLDLPWNTSLFTGLTFKTTAANVLQPAGFTSICNANLYENYRVLDCTMSIDVVPQSVADSVLVVLTPALTSGANVQTDLAQPWAKSYFFCSGRTAPGRNGLTNRVQVSRLAGVAERAIVDDLSLQYCGKYNTIPVRTLYWRIAIETGDNATLASPLCIRMRLRWHVELFGLMSANLPVT